MNHGSCRLPSIPANWPGYTPWLEWTIFSGSTALPGQMPRRRVTAPATAAIDGQSLPWGWLARKLWGTSVRPVSIT